MVPICWHVLEFLLNTTYAADQAGAGLESAVALRHCRLILLACKRSLTTHPSEECSFFRAALHSRSIAFPGLMVLGRWVYVTDIIEEKGLRQQPDSAEKPKPKTVVSVARRALHGSIMAFAALVALGGQSGGSFAWCL